MPQTWAPRQGALVREHVSTFVAVPIRLILALIKIFDHPRAHDSMLHQCLYKYLSTRCPSASSSNAKTLHRDLIPTPASWLQQKPYEPDSSQSMSSSERSAKKTLPQALTTVTTVSPNVFTRVSLLVHGSYHFMHGLALCKSPLV